jgi:homoserine kinase type II
MMDRSVDVMQEAVSKFLENRDKLTFFGTHGSVNNIVRKVHTESNDEYILRIYNNGNDFEKVQFEHAVLKALKSLPLSFSLPNAIPSLENMSTHVLLSDGSFASLFYLIPGDPPHLSSFCEIGKSCGELTNALATISNQLSDQIPPTPPYFEIYKVHRGINRESFFAEMQSVRLDGVRNAADFMINEVQQIESLIVTLLAKNLPQQLIHGDLHHDNVLVLNGKVSGVLDFEFCALDWRAMDLAITLSKYAGESEPMDKFREVIKGYTHFVTLTTTEVEVIPDLIILRILSNVVYFVGRALSGEDRIETLTTRIENYAMRIKWLRAHKEEMVKCFREI